MNIWETIENDNGYAYYWNTVSNETTYEKPEGISI